MLHSIIGFFGHFHPVLVHLPIGILIAALLLHWAYRKNQFELPPLVANVLWGSGALAAILSCITGLMLHFSGEYEEVVVWHMWLGIGVAVVSVLAAWKVFRRSFDRVFTILGILLLLLLTATGHLGGELTHGEGYLTAAFGGEDEEAAKDLPPIPDVQEAKIYQDIIEPIFNTKCYSCHGSKKQKGKLRMDSPEFLLTGGEGGEIMVAGKAEESELIKRLLLPKDHKEHMPPKQRPQLRSHYIKLIEWWVDQGAAFDKKVSELEQSEEMQQVFTALQEGRADEEPDGVEPELPVDAADPKAIAALQNKSIVVLPVAQASNYLAVNFVSAGTVTDEDLQGLLPIREQLQSLKLNNTHISDSAMAVIAQCSNLRVLQLNNTAITDNGLAQLANLSKLRLLSLVGTSVTGQGILHLKELPQLRAVYLFHTQINTANWPQLKAAFPKTHLDTGNYRVPTLATDTIEIKYQPK